MKKRITRILTGTMSLTMAMSLVPVNLSIVKAESFKYVVMNIPFSEFYAAEKEGNALKSLEQQTSETVDAVSTATTSKFKGTSGLAKGTYYGADTEVSKGNILGVTFPVKMSEEDYNSLKETYLYVDEKGTNEYVADVKASHYFKDYVGTPATYKELTYNSGKYDFSKAITADKDVTGLSIADFRTTSSYGDYQISLAGVKPSGEIAGEATTIYGAIFVDSDNAGYAMYALDNMWFATKMQDLEIAWSVKNGRELKRGHGSGPAFYQYDMNGKTLSKVILMTSAGNYTISAATAESPNGLALTEYYKGDLSSLKCSVENGSNELKLSGIPSELKDVSVTVSGGLATNATISDGKVILSSNPVEGKSYTVTINSSNYAGISRTVATPISDAQKNELTKWETKAKVSTDYLNNAELKKLVADSEALRANADATSVEASTLIKKLISSVKATYGKYEVFATVEGSNIAITLNGVELSSLENPTYTLSYTQGRSSVALVSGDFKELSFVLSKAPTVGTKYTLSIVSDNYQDAKVEVTAAAAPENPAPQNPGADSQTPQNPGADNQTPQNPGADSQTPQNPTTGSQTPENPAPQNPAPQNPAPQDTIVKQASEVKLADKTVKYTGKAVGMDAANVTGSTGEITYTYYSDAECTKALSKTPVNAGTYYVKATVAADDKNEAATSNVAKLVIKKAAQSITKVTSSKTVKYSKLKKNKQSFTISASVLGKAKVTYKKTSGNKNISVASNGKVTVKKGTKKGTYTIKVKISAAATTNYASKTVTKSLKVVVK